MSTDPNGTFSRSHVQAVIDAIARQVTDPADAPLFATTRALVDIVVWRVVHGQTVEQITQFLADNVTPDAAS
ncbi:hypothetical protein, partial [Amycolatopsis sp. NPDC059657]|uniref:hypothetical protein n=1 Tax=Amycolatopsis sp. NPDC059657 TaxID=3346899 RepID=UPI00367270A6